MSLGNKAKKILVTRPESMAQESLQLLNDLGFKAFSCPLTKLEPLNYHLPILPNNFIIIANSRFALLYLKNKDIEKLKSKTIYVVGEKTTKMAKQLGFTSIITNKNAEELAKAIKDNITPDNLLLYLAGQVRYDIFLSYLQEYSFNIVEIYTTLENEPEIFDYGYMDAILFYSASAARAAIQLLPYISQETKFFCISSRVCEYLPKEWQLNSFFSEDPNQKSLFKCLEANLTKQNN